jgi:hypothetical protein
MREERDAAKRQFYNHPNMQSQANALQQTLSNNKAMRSQMETLREITSQIKSQLKSSVEQELADFIRD